ncbi:hypothetical protein C0991_001878 [Blastosporella zonata]|nr:hypothetical protein C0991_001878 [Blastosporella zonata]
MGILSHNKSQLFLNNHYESHIMPRFHPYFNPFKDLMLRWWYILRTAHQYPTLFETPHLWLESTLLDTCDTLKTTYRPTKDDIEKTEDVKARRVQDLLQLRDSNYPSESPDPSHHGILDLSPSGPTSNYLTDYSGKSIPLSPSSPTPRSKKPKVEVETTANRR